MTSADGISINEEGEHSRSGKALKAGLSDTCARAATAVAGGEAGEAATEGTSESTVTAADLAAASCMSASATMAHQTRKGISFPSEIRLPAPEPKGEKNNLCCSAVLDASPYRPLVVASPCGDSRSRRLSPSAGEAPDSGATPAATDVPSIYSSVPLECGVALASPKKKAAAPAQQPVPFFAAKDESFATVTASEDLRAASSQQHQLIVGSSSYHSPHAQQALQRQEQRYSADGISINEEGEHSRSGKALKAGLSDTCARAATAVAGGEAGEAATEGTSESTVTAADLAAASCMSASATMAHQTRKGISFPSEIRLPAPKPKGEKNNLCCSAVLDASPYRPLVVASPCGDSRSRRLSPSAREAPDSGATPAATDVPSIYSSVPLECGVALASPKKKAAAPAQQPVPFFAAKDESFATVTASEDLRAASSQQHQLIVGSSSYHSPHAQQALQRQEQRYSAQHESQPQQHTLQEQQQHQQQQQQLQQQQSFLQQQHNLQQQHQQLHHLSLQQQQQMGSQQMRQHYQSPGYSEEDEQHQDPHEQQKREQQWCRRDCRLLEDVREQTPLPCQQEQEQQEQQQQQRMPADTPPQCHPYQQQQQPVVDSQTQQHQQPFVVLQPQQQQIIQQQQVIQQQQLVHEQRAQQQQPQQMQIQSSPPTYGTESSTTVVCIENSFSPGSSAAESKETFHSACNDAPMCSPAAETRDPTNNIAPHLPYEQYREIATGNDCATASAIAATSALCAVGPTAACASASAAASPCGGARATNSAVPAPTAAADGAAASVTPAAAAPPADPVSLPGAAAIAPASAGAGCDVSAYASFWSPRPTMTAPTAAAAPAPGDELQLPASGISTHASPGSSSPTHAALHQQRRHSMTSPDCATGDSAGPLEPPSVPKFSSKSVVTTAAACLSSSSSYSVSIGGGTPMRVAAPAASGGGSPVVTAAAVPSSPSFFSSSSSSSSSVTIGGLSPQMVTAAGAASSLVAAQTAAYMGSAGAGHFSPSTFPEAIGSRERGEKGTLRVTAAGDTYANHSYYTAPTTLQRLPVLPVSYGYSSLSSLTSPAATTFDTTTTGSRVGPVGSNCHVSNKVAELQQQAYLCTHQQGPQTSCFAENYSHYPHLYQQQQQTDTTQQQWGGTQQQYLSSLNHLGDAASSAGWLSAANSVGYPSFTVLASPPPVLPATLLKDIEIISPARAPLHALRPWDPQPENEHQSSSLHNGHELKYHLMHTRQQLRGREVHKKNAHEQQEQQNTCQRKQQAKEEQHEVQETQSKLQHELQESHQHKDIDDCEQPKQKERGFAEKSDVARQCQTAEEENNSQMNKSRDKEGKMRSKKGASGDIRRSTGNVNGGNGQEQQVTLTARGVQRAALGETASRQQQEVSGSRRQTAESVEAAAAKAEISEGGLGETKSSSGGHGKLLMRDGTMVAEESVMKDTSAVYDSKRGRTRSNSCIGENELSSFTDKAALNSPSATKQHSFKHSTKSTAPSSKATLEGKSLSAVTTATATTTTITTSSSCTPARNGAAAAAAFAGGASAASASSAASSAGSARASGVPAPAAATGSKETKKCAAQLVEEWLAQEGLGGLQRLFVDALLLPPPRSNNSSRLLSLAMRAAQLPSIPGVIYDAHQYQFLARYYETEDSVTPVTRRFPLRRWGFFKSYRFACDVVQQAARPGVFEEGEIMPVEECCTTAASASNSNLISSSSPNRPHSSSTHTSSLPGEVLSAGCTATEDHPCGAAASSEGGGSNEVCSGAGSSLVSPEASLRRDTDEGSDQQQLRKANVRSPNDTSTLSSSSDGATKSRQHHGPHLHGSAVEYYVLPESPEMYLPVVKGITRDKKGKRWSVCCKGQRQHIYDKDAEGGPRDAYEAAVHLRRQQVQQVEFQQLYDDALVHAMQGDDMQLLLPCYQAVLTALLRDLQQSLLSFPSYSHRNSSATSTFPSHQQQEKMHINMQEIANHQANTHGKEDIYQKDALENENFYQRSHYNTEDSQQRNTIKAAASGSAPVVDASNNTQGAAEVNALNAVSLNGSKSHATASLKSDTAATVETGRGAVLHLGLDAPHATKEREDAQHQQQQPDSHVMTPLPLKPHVRTASDTSRNAVTAAIKNDITALRKDFSTAVDAPSSLYLDSGVAVKAVSTILIVSSDGSADAAAAAETTQRHLAAEMLTSSVQVQTHHRDLQTLGDETRPAEVIREKVFTESVSELTDHSEMAASKSENPAAAEAANMSVKEASAATDVIFSRAEEATQPSEKHEQMSTESEEGAGDLKRRSSDKSGATEGGNTLLTPTQCQRPSVAREELQQRQSPQQDTSAEATKLSHPKYSNSIQEPSHSISHSNVSSSRGGSGTSGSDTNSSNSVEATERAKVKVEECFAAGGERAASKTGSCVSPDRRTENHRDEKQQRSGECTRENEGGERAAVVAAPGVTCPLVFPADVPQGGVSQTVQSEKTLQQRNNPRQLRCTVSSSDGDEIKTSSKEERGGAVFSCEATVGGEDRKEVEGDEHSMAVEKKRKQPVIKEETEEERKRHRTQTGESCTITQSHMDKIQKNEDERKSGDIVAPLSYTRRVEMNEAERKDTVVAPNQGYEREKNQDEGKNLGREEEVLLANDREACVQAARVAAAHVEYVQAAVLAVELHEHLYIFRDCIKKQCLPSALPLRQQLQLSVKLLEMQVGTIRDILTQTGFWKHILFDALYARRAASKAALAAASAPTAAAPFPGASARAREREPTSKAAAAADKRDAASAGNSSCR